MGSNFWDSRFAAEHYIYGQDPNAHLAAQAHRIKSGGRVLVPGDGEGRNGVWLARQGFDVLSIDQSAVGLDKAQRLAAQHRITIATEQADLLTWSWPTLAFDAIASIFLHFIPDERHHFHQAVISALRPGGVLILEAFTPDQLSHASGGPKDRALLYNGAELAKDFAAMEIVSLQESEVELNEGTHHQGPAATVRLVAIKPT